MRFCAMHIRAISQKVLKNSIHNINDTFENIATSPTVDYNRHPIARLEGGYDLSFVMYPVLFTQT